MSKSSKIVTDAVMAASEPRFIAPGLVDAGGDAPRLIAGKCRECGALSFPQSQVCTRCLSDQIDGTHLASVGVLYSFATVHQAPRNWIVPYHLGYIDLTDGIRVLAHLEGTPRISARMRLGVGRVGTDKDGTPLMSYVFTAMDGERA